ncbi:HAD hydrolase-like protein [Micrococcales bacterium 31B]|nr:HAD hydrolase-like protein [Micrococcales bacterium 31B]
MYRYVLFDLDGTLTDSAPGIWASLHHALETVGEPPPAEHLKRSFIGPPLHDSMRDLLGLEPRQVEDAYQAYRDRYTRIGWSENSPFAGMHDLVLDVRAAGCRVAVATSKPEHTAVQILEHFGMADAFEFIAGATEDGTRRRKADVVRRALDQLGAGDLAPGEGILVGDREHDTEGAAEHGLDCVLVEWGYGSPEEHEDATHWVSSVAELRALLLPA